MSKVRLLSKSLFSRRKQSCVPGHLGSGSVVTGVSGSLPTQPRPREGPSRGSRRATLLTVQESWSGVCLSLLVRGTRGPTPRRLTTERGVHLAGPRRPARGQGEAPRAHGRLVAPPVGRGVPGGACAVLGGVPPTAGRRAEDGRVGRRGVAILGGRAPGRWRKGGGPVCVHTGRHGRERLK